MLGIQGHPEFNIDIFLHFIERITNRNLIQVRIIYTQTSSSFIYALMILIPMFN